MCNDVSPLPPLDSRSQVASLHPRGRDGHRPVGSAGSHRLLGADRPPPTARVRREAGLLGGEDGPGALAVRTDRDRQDRQRRNHSGPSGRPGAGMRPPVSAHAGLWKEVQRGPTTQHAGGTAEGHGEEESGVEAAGCWGEG